MADYWVSQTKKYCEFCKCWITDNKPSVDFHEKGRRHQENIKKRLRNITRQSTQTQKDADKFGATIKQMEFAALEAYRKDVENNPDLTSVDGLRKLWKEVKSREGTTSYVNSLTNETVAQPPREGYLSIAEQREQSYLETKKQLSAVEKFKRNEGLLNMQELRQQEAEEQARLAREKMKERRVVDDIAPVTCGPLLEPGKTDPYGRWQVITESPLIDLQLPRQEQYFEAPVEFVPEPVREFHEKKVESLGSGEASFKKRKLGSGAKRNARQRLDDD